ncbi:hypothetical protein Lal_00025809 [Lupinus albus]|nr:hypothetical protein Lal_00025809 [Lupinus albus]
MINNPAPTEPSLEELNIDIDIDVPCTSLYTSHACTDSELCDSCIDEFLNIVVDSPVTHSHCTNTIVAGIRQQSDLFVQVQAATKPSFATFFPSVLQAPNWTPHLTLSATLLLEEWDTQPDSRLSERVSPEREMAHLGVENWEILKDSRLSDICLAWARERVVETRGSSLVICFRTHLTKEGGKGEIENTIMHHHIGEMEMQECIHDCFDEYKNKTRLISKLEDMSNSTNNKAKAQDQ